MRKLFFLVAAFVCASTSQAYADYSFIFNGSAVASNSNTYTYDFSGNLTSATNTPDGNGNVVVTGGTLTATGTAYNGTTFNVIGLSSPYGNLNGYATNTVRSAVGGDVYTYDNVIAPGIDPLLPSAQAGLILEGVYKNENIVIGLSSAGADHNVIFDHSYADDTYNLGYTENGVSLTESTATATPTPIPAAAYLLGSGLLSFCGIRRKKV